MASYNSSCDTCENVSDNKQNSCPPRMSDGRHFTDYKPRCAVHESLVNGKVLNSYDLRQHLIRNADALMDARRAAATSTNKCGPCVEPWNQGTMLPEQAIVHCDAAVCHTATNDPYGLGQGRSYGTLTNSAYINSMSAENAAMGAKQCNDCLKPSDKLKSSPPAVTEEMMSYRAAVPGGGEPYIKW